MDFGINLKKLRKERGLSQDELAVLLCTSKQVISRYENGQRVPKLSVVSDYARKLGVSLRTLSGEVDMDAGSCGRRVPILGGAACGEPIYQPSDGTETIVVDEDIPCDFALIAQGDSMTGDRIYSGDVVFIRKQDTVRDGEIAAVALDGELTLKHVRRLRGPDGSVVFTQLLPSNPAYSPIDIGGEGETRMVRILGKAVAVRFAL